MSTTSSPCSQGCHAAQAGCAKQHCGACCGGACGNNAPLYLDPQETALLLYMAQVAFLPMARKSPVEAPVCLEETPVPADALTRTIKSLARKRLLQVDDDIPLAQFDYAAYQGYPLRGSMALSAFGWQIVEQLDYQGLEA